MFAFLNFKVNLDCLSYLSLHFILQKQKESNVQTVRRAPSALIHPWFQHTES